MSEIKTKCWSKIFLKWDEIEDVQKNVKTISPKNLKKLVNSLINFGFSEPLGVWQKPNGKYICLSGNQRLKALKKARDDGVSVPNKVPINLITADNEKEAKKLLLALASTYGEVNINELKKFVIDEFDPDSFIELESSISFPGLSVNLNFEEKKGIISSFSGSGGPKDEDEDDFEDDISLIKIPCVLSKIKPIENKLESIFSKLKSDEIKFKWQALEKILNEVKL